MVDGAERLIDHQVRAAEELDDKAEHMIKVAIATLGGALTVALFVGQEPEIDATRSSALFFGVGLLLNLAAVVSFIDSYIGFRRPLELYPAPDIGWLNEKRSTVGWNLEVHLESLLSSYANYSESNVTKMEQSAQKRRAGLYILMTCVATYVLAIAFIVARSI
jgi:hypothetical protein